MKEIAVDASRFFLDIIAILQVHVTKDTIRSRIYEDLIELFDNMLGLDRDDWDGIEEYDPMIGFILDEYYLDIGFDPDFDIE